MGMNISLGVFSMITRQQAIESFCQEYVAIHGLKIPAKSVISIIENKLVETHNAFYLRDTHLRLNKNT
jgi:hypothetical protein